MGCLAKDNNDNNDANAVHCRPRQGERSYTRKSKVRGVPERVERWWLKATKGEKDEGKVVWGKDGKLANWVIPRPNSSSCQNEEGNIISLPSVFLFTRCHPYPPPSAPSPPPFLRFPLSLIESSNFRLHSPSACLLCRPVRIQRTLCRNLGTRTRWRVHSPGADSRLKRGKGQKRGGGKNKEPGQNAELSYSYRDWEKVVSAERRTVCAAAIGKKI